MDDFVKCCVITYVNTTALLVQLCWSDKVIMQVLHMSTYCT